MYIPYIVMEWLLVLRNEGNNCPNLPQVIQVSSWQGEATPQLDFVRPSVIANFIIGSFIIRWLNKFGYFY